MSTASSPPTDYGSDTLLILAIILTTVGALLAGLYLSGAAGDFVDFVGERYLGVEEKEGEEVKVGEVRGFFSLVD